MTEAWALVSILLARADGCIELTEDEIVNVPRLDIIFTYHYIDGIVTITAKPAPSNREPAIIRVDNRG